MSERTPLFSRHQAAGARLVDFAGWELPVHYGDLVAEHHAVRQRVGMFDVSHMGVVDITGPDALRFLRLVLANDLAKARLPGKAVYGCLLQQDGGIIDDVIAYRFAHDQVRLVVNAARRAVDVAWLRSQAAAYQLTITLRSDLAMLAVQGPQARARVHDHFPTLAARLQALRPFQALCEADDLMIARTGYTGEQGYEIIATPAAIGRLWDGLLAAGVAPCGLGARDTLRLEAGLNLYGQDMDTTTSPLVCGLAWTVDFSDVERAFIGREALQAQLETGIPSRQVGLLLCARGVLRPGYPLLLEGVPIGQVTSGTQSPTLGRSIGLGRLPVEVPERLEVGIRTRRLPLSVVPYPFARAGKSLLDTARYEES